MIPPAPPPNSLTKTLYIAIEIVDRELGGAVLLAAEAVSRGWRVVLGGKKGIFENMTRFKNMPGVFFLKSIVPGEVFKQKEIMADGHRITSLDVEGLVPSNGESGVRLRYSDESIDLTDLLFFWGQNHYDSIQKVYPKIKEKSVVSGSPIIDEILVRGKRSRAKHLNTPKKRILIGTSCGYANHINGIEFSRKMTQDAYGKNVDKAASQTLEYEALLDQRIFEYWKEAVPQIATSFKDYDVVLRPHPSENKEFWKSHLKSFKNVYVDFGRPILEEMLRSDVYVHFNSTSALTSNILGIPTFMPLPEVKKEWAARITFVKDISITAPTTEDLIQKIKSYVGDSRPELARAELSQYCENLKRDDISAARLMVDAFEKKYTFRPKHGDILERDFSERLIVDLKKLKFFLMWIAGLVLSALGMKPGQMFPPRNAYKNANAKQPNTRLDKVTRMMTEVLEESMVDRINVEQKATNLFILSQRSAK